MWKRLGFNTIPSDGIVSASGTLAPSQRSGPEWKGLRYGVMMSAFSGGGPAGVGSMAALKMSVAAAQSYNLSAVGVNETDVPRERAKLLAAATFYAKNAPIIDLSYDGVFYRKDVEAVVAVVNYSRPDDLSFDVEGSVYTSTSRLLQQIPPHNFVLDCSLLTRMTCVPAL